MSVIISLGPLEAIHYVQGTVFISQHFLQQSIIASDMWLIRENLKVLCLFEENHCSLAPLKVPTFSTKLVATIFVRTHPIFSW